MAEIVAGPVPIRAGAKGVIQIAIKNVSRVDMVVALEDVIRSYFFTAESNEEIQFDGDSRRVIRDRNGGNNYCPGDVPTFLVRPGQTLIHIVGIAVPKELHGKAKLEMALRILRLDSKLQCGPATEMELNASGVLKIDPFE